MKLRLHTEPDALLSRKKGVRDGGCAHALTATFWFALERGLYAFGMARTGVLQGRYAARTWHLQLATHQLEVDIAARCLRRRGVGFNLGRGLYLESGWKTHLTYGDRKKTMIF